MRLRNRTSLVTGASRGIGKAIAITFAQQGSDIIVNYVTNVNKAEEVVEEIIKMGRKAFSVRANVGNKSEVLKMVEEGIKEFGKIDVLVNNAGINWKTGNMLEASEEEWRNVLQVNLLGTYYCIQAIVPYMIKQKYGKIVNISSVAGIGTSIGTGIGTAGRVAYAPSKAGVNILTKKFAHELGVYNINVNAIAPGAIKTELLCAGRSEEELEKLIEGNANLAALRRIGEPQDIANVALFLASDDSSFITGQVIVADGGKFDYLAHGV